MSGLSLQEAKSLILEQHKINVSEDDPVMMVVTLHEAFLKDQSALLEKHNQALTLAMSGVVETFRQELSTETESFRTVVKSVALEHMTALVSQHQTNMAAHAQTVKFWTLLVLVAGVCVFLGMMLPHSFAR